MKRSPGAPSSLPLKLLKSLNQGLKESFLPLPCSWAFENHIHTFLFLLSSLGPFPILKLWDSCTPTYVRPRLNSKDGPVYPPFPPNQLSFITVHNWNWRPLGFPYFEKAQKKHLQLLMNDCREELKLSQQRSRFVLAQILIQFIIQGLESQYQVGVDCPPCALLEPLSAFVYFLCSVKHHCSSKLSVIWGRKILSMPLALQRMMSLIYKLVWCGGGRRGELPSPSCCLSDAELVLQLLSAALVRSQCARIALKVKICWLDFLQLPTQKAS